VACLVCRSSEISANREIKRVPTCFR